MGAPQFGLGRGLERVPRGYRTTALAAAAVVTASLLIYATASCSLNRQLHAWKVLPEPERLTELYYENHTHLPATYQPGKPQSFTFTVHNLEGRRTAYAYIISQQPDSSQTATVLVQGSFTINDNGYHSQPITVSPADMGTRSQIITSIAFPSPADTSSHQPENQTQALHYWVSKEGA